MSKKRARTYARNRTAVSRRGNLKQHLLNEPDSVFLLKLTLILLLSSLWFRLSSPLKVFFTIYSLPVGALLVFLLVRHLEHNPFNRRLWYLLIIVISLVSFFLPVGIML